MGSMSWFRFYRRYVYLPSLSLRSDGKGLMRIESWGVGLVEPKTNVKSMLSSKNFRPYIYKYGEVVSSSVLLSKTVDRVERGN